MGEGGDILRARIDGPLAVVGDVHGQRELLVRLVEQLRLATPDFGERWLVFVGDFLDRGPDPKGALESVLEIVDSHAKTTAVMGNHDLALAGALGLVDVPEQSRWPERYRVSYDPRSTFASYGAPRGDLEALSEAMPARHGSFLAGLPWIVEHPDFLVVHAGVLQHKPLAEQLPTLRRRDFSLRRPPWLCAQGLAELDPPDDCPLTVVSGHVAVPKVTFRERRILVDTSGGYGRSLSAALLPERRAVTVRREAG